MTETTFVYEFAYADGGIDRLITDNKIVAQFLPTFGEDSVTLYNEQYTYASVDHGNVKQTPQVEKQTLTLVFSINNTVARKFVQQPNPISAVLTVFEVDLVNAFNPNNPPKKVVWTGTISSAVIKGERIELVSLNLFGSLKQSGNRARYNRLCRHALYGEGCGVPFDTPANRKFGDLLSVQGALVVVKMFGNYTDKFFTGGLLRQDNDLYFVLAETLIEVDGNRDTIGFTLDRPLRSATTSLNLFPGCDRTQTTCHFRFNNLDNFGGFPYIPQRNPFKLTSVV